MVKVLCVIFSRISTEYSVNRFKLWTLEKHKRSEYSLDIIAVEEHIEDGVDHWGRRALEGRPVPSASSRCWRGYFTWTDATHRTDLSGSDIADDTYVSTSSLEAIDCRIVTNRKLKRNCLWINLEYKKYIFFWRYSARIEYCEWHSTW